MDRSQAHGTDSSGSGDPLAKLCSLAANSPLIEIVNALGQQADLHLVGGSVRDVLMGIAPADFDLATLLRPEECVRLLNAADIRVIETGLKHGTVTAVVDGHNVELTTFRKPGVHAQAEYSKSIEEDLNARDFTINALAWSIGRKRLIDPSNGKEDLRAKRLRAVGSAEERFKEDPLRILRMFRFGPAQGFIVDQQTSDAARKLVSTLAKVSAERVRNEFEKILISPNPAQCLRALLDFSIIDLFLPELLPSVGFEQNDYHTQDVFEHTLSVIERTPPDLTLRLAALFHDSGKPASLSVDADGSRHFYEHEVISEELCRTAMRRLHFSKEQIQDVCSIVRYHMRPVDCGPTGARRLIRDLDHNFERWRLFKYADATPTIPVEQTLARLKAFDELITAERTRVAQVKKRTLAITGDDLISIGYKPGKKLGALLKELEELVLDDPEKNDKEFLLRLAQNKLGTD